MLLASCSSLSVVLLVTFFILIALAVHCTAQKHRAAMNIMPAGVDALKKKLRKEIAKKLRDVSPETKRGESNLIVQQFLRSDVYQASKYISLYLSTDSEADTRPILDDIFATGRVCYVPYYNKESMQMLRLQSLADYESLPETKWKIKQPADSEGRENALVSGTLDLVVVPGVAFGLQGQRLGHGRAYYDRFFRHCVTKANVSPHKVGLAFTTQLSNDIPMTETDVWMDRVFFASAEMTPPG